MALDNADLDPFGDPFLPDLPPGLPFDDATGEEIELTILDLEVGPLVEAGYAPVTLQTTRGDIETRYYPGENAACGVLFFGHASGYDSPLNGRIYPRLAGEFQEDGHAALRVRYRRIGQFEECVLDALAAIAFLEAQGVRQIAVVGHGFGGAVALRAAAESDRVTACVALAPSGRIDESPGELADRCSLLMFDDLAEPAASADTWFTIDLLNAASPRFDVPGVASEDRDAETEERLAGKLYDWVDAQLGR